MNNCYAYARNDPSGTFLQPGALSGSKYNNYPGCSGSGYFSCANLVANAINDGMRATWKRGGKQVCPRGWHKVSLFVDTLGYHYDPNTGVKGDYHWYREDTPGYWSNKPGGTSVTANYADGSGPIIDPFKDAKINHYDTPCGCLCAKDKPWRTPIRP